MESRLKAALRIARKLVDALAILALILLAILSIGFVGNAYPSLPDSDLDLYLEFVQCVFWILVPVIAARLAFETRLGAGFACLARILWASYFPPNVPYLNRLFLSDVSVVLSYRMEAVFIAFGLYWLLTAALGWPPILAPPRLPSWRRKFAFIFGSAFVFGLGLTLMALIAVLPPNLDDRAEYMLPPPSPSPAGPNQAAFVATDVVGINWAPPRYVGPAQILGWLALSRVKEYFWGLPWWSRRYVLLLRPPQWRGQDYFYAGLRPEGIFARFLPVASFFEGSSRTNLVRDAELDLRVLREGPTPTKVRILGRFRGLSRNGTPPNVAGIKVTITRPPGTLQLSTNDNGFYYASGLTPGSYAIQFDVPEDLLLLGGCRGGQVHLEAGQTMNCNVDLFSATSKQAP